MDLFEAIRKRRSIRKYKKSKIDERYIGLILWSAAQAPTAGNMREWRFVVVKDEKRKELLYRAALEQEHIKQAPVVIVVGVDVEIPKLKYGERGVLVYSLEDAAAAIENMLLAATALGLGSCWIGAFDEEEVRNIIGFPYYVRPVAIVTLGYPDEKPREKKIDYSRYCFEETYGKRWEFEFNTLEDAIRKILRKYIVQPQNKK